MKILINTNVILDFLLDSREPFHEMAVRALKLTATHGMTCCITASQATDIFYCLRKAVGKQVARESLEGVFALCEVIDTTAASCVRALGSQMDDFEDAVQAFSAYEHGCDLLLTRNTRDFQDGPIRVMEPVDFISDFSDGAV